MRQHTASTSSSTDPGVQRMDRSVVAVPVGVDGETRSAGDNTSPICSRSLATMAPPVAIYSKIFVGDPKKRLSTI